MTGNRMSRERTGLLVIDVQERLAGAMEPAAMAEVRRKTAMLIKGAAVLGLPVVVTEQYPKGLGKTVPEVADALPADVILREKMVFSCGRDPGVMSVLEAAGRLQWVIAGMETHVCVFQTARDLVERGWEVFVAQDAVLSRKPADMELGLKLIERTGAAITCVETALFDLLERAGTPEFKAINALVK